MSRCVRRAARPSAVIGANGHVHNRAVDQVSIRAGRLSLLGHAGRRLGYIGQAHSHLQVSIYYHHLHTPTVAHVIAPLPCALCVMWFVVHRKSDSRRSRSPRRAPRSRSPRRSSRSRSPLSRSPRKTRARSRSRSRSTREREESARASGPATGQLNELPMLALCHDQHTPQRTSYLPNNRLGVESALGTAFQTSSSSSCSSSAATPNNRSAHSPAIGDRGSSEPATSAHAAVQRMQANIFSQPRPDSPVRQ
jgi:hypothetical protein